MESSRVPRCLVLALAMALTIAGCGREEGASARGGYQGVEMDESGGGAGTVTDAARDPYRDAGVGAVGTDAAPPAATGDGREGPDTVHRAGTGVPADTIR